MLSSLNVLQSSFRGKTALSNSTLLQKVSFAGKEYSLEPIDEPPLFFFSGLKQGQSDTKKEKYQY